MKLKLRVANDNGNSEQDLIINNKLIQQPNVFAKIHRLPNLDEISQTYVLENIHENLIVTVNGNIYYVGEYALKSGKRCRSIDVGGDNKIESEIVYVNTLAHIAAEAVRIAVSEHAALDEIDLIEVNVDMATALPISYYSAQNANHFAEKFTAKQHLVSVHIGNKVICTKLTFDFVKVIPEGVTASFAITHTDFTTGDMTDKKILHVAIGEGTTEFPITTNCVFKPDFIVGTNNGIGQAIDRVIGDFKRTFGLSNFNRQDFSMILKDPYHKYFTEAKEFIEIALEEEADEILITTRHVIKEAKNDIDFVCVYGGGSILMRENLENRLKNFCEKAKIQMLYVDEEKAVTIEAAGLNVFLNSDLFQRIKSMKGVKKGM